LTSPRSSKRHATLAIAEAALRKVGGALNDANELFAPTQALAMRWAKRRLEGDESRIRKLIGRLHVWRTTEAP